MVNRENKNKNNPLLVSVNKQETNQKRQQKARQETNQKRVDQGSTGLHMLPRQASGHLCCLALLCCICYQDKINNSDYIFILYYNIIVLVHFSSNTKRVLVELDK
jgi:hypothetical protein